MNKFSFYLEEYLKDNSKSIYDNYFQIKEIINTPYNYMPEFDPIRGEICKCLIFGLNVAAITATNF
jgi:hypothetical protein